MYKKRQKKKSNNNSQNRLQSSMGFLFASYSSLPTALVKTFLTFFFQVSNSK